MLLKKDSHDEGLTDAMVAAVSWNMRVLETESYCMKYGNHVICSSEGLGTYKPFYANVGPNMGSSMLKITPFFGSF